MFSFRFVLEVVNTYMTMYLAGPMVWYQKFEYAIGHWFQKATEHMIGCVLCSPGCFSLFRGSALMDDNVMRRYATTSTEARHYVQYDQGNGQFTLNECNRKQDVAFPIAFV